MPHAAIEGKVMCAGLECVQPGTETIVVQATVEGDVLRDIELEFCERCARMQRYRLGMED